MDARISSVLHDRQGELVELREKELEAQRDLNYFRRRHDLNRVAKYRESPWLFAAILLGAVCGLERRASGGILAPILTHITWSLSMLFLLPLLFS